MSLSRNRSLPRHGARLVWSLILCVGGLSSSGCGLQAPAKPSWSVTVRTPLAERTITVADLVSHNGGYLSVDSSGTAALHVDQSFGDIQVGDALSIADVAIAGSTPVGNFHVNPPAPAPVTINLDDIWPQALQFNGQQAAVPVLQFSLSEQASTNSFQSAEVAQGTLAITLTNQLPVSVNASSLQISNADNSGALGTASIPALLPGQSTTVLISLAGKHLTPGWTGTWTGSSPGSSSPVPITSGALVQVSFAFQGPMVVSAAVAPLPAQALSFLADAALPSDNALSSAAFTAGSLQLTIDNRWGIGGTLQLTLPGVRDAGGEPLTQTVFLGASRFVTASFPLAHCSFTAVQSNGPRVQVQGNLLASSSGSRMVTIQASDPVVVDGHMLGAHFSSVAGRFSPFLVTLDPQTRSVDLPDGLTGLDLAEAGALLTVTSTAGVPAHISLQISGTDASNHEWTLTGPQGTGLTLDVPAAAPGGTAIGTLALSGANSNLPAFVGHLPRILRVSGSAEVGSSSVDAQVSQADQFSSRIHLESALLAAFEPAEIQVDPQSSSLTQSLRDQILGRLQRVRVHARIENGLPLGASAHLVVAGSAAGVSAPGAGSVQLDASVLAGDVDPSTGVVRAARVQDVTVEVRPENLEVFQNPTLYVGGSVSLPGTAGQRVRVRAVDQVKARVWLEVEGKVVR